MVNQMAKELWSTRFYSFMLLVTFKNIQTKDWRYVGEFKNGKFHGAGTFHWSELNYYEGGLRFFY